jgi:hypothetical protein
VLFVGEIEASPGTRHFVKNRIPWVKKKMVYCAEEEKTPQIPFFGYPLF